MILEPANAQDALRPLRQQNLVDAANDSLNTSAAGRAQTVPTGRGRGIIVTDQPAKPLWDIIKRTTPIDAQGGRYNGVAIDWLDAKPNATSNVIEADFGTFSATDDDVILWEIQPADGLVAAFLIGFDRESQKPIFAIPSQGYFPVGILQDGGSQGTASTAASWTYTVQTITGETIKENVGLARPRPRGIATYQPSGGYGMAFYSAGDIILWDAGEIYGSTTCP
jgi:hypothetical protein